MGSSIFATMSQIIFETKPEVPSLAYHLQKEKTEEIFPLIVAVLTVIIIIDFLPPIQERRHLLKSVGIRISVAKFEINDGVSLSVP